MENLAHSLLAVVVARTGLSREVVGGTATLVVAANLPDIDVIAAINGPLHYLEYHRGVTHSLVAVPVFGIAFSFLLWISQRLRNGKSPPLSRMIFAISLVVATHPLLDWTNSYGLRPFLPFDDARLFGDLVFIVDPYLWILLGVPAFLTCRYSGKATLVWITAALGALLAAFWLSSFESIGPTLPAVLLVSIAVTVYLKYRKPVWSQRLAFVSLGLLVGYWGLLFLARESIITASTPELEQRFPHLSNLSALPRLADPLSWDLYFEQDGTLFYGSMSVFYEAIPEFERYLRNLNLPPVQAARQSCAGAVVDYFGRYHY
ncbi:MAG TPA: metal-dependent hydrolase, partial [Acidobacteriota bacterium]|nr:metal-dependent hydrolase [Acidobacteriota bacterium]